MGWLDLVFPKKCVGCGKYGGYVCEKCEVGLWEEEQICPSCCRNSRYGIRHKYCKGDLEGLTCLWAYEGLARKLISNVKYRYFYDQLDKLVILDDRIELEFFRRFLTVDPVVVPVPLHPKRLRERGFNQATLIGEAFAARHSLAYNSHLLLRVKETKPQVGRTREERLESLNGAFNITPRPPLNLRGGANILLVDDVWTTGATMRECARVLRAAGVKQVWGFVLAR